MSRIDIWKNGTDGGARAFDAYAARLEREFAEDLLPWRVSALLIFVSAIFSWVVTYGLGVFIYSLMVS